LVNILDVLHAGRLLQMLSNTLYSLGRQAHDYWTFAPALKTPPVLHLMLQVAAGQLPASWKLLLV
jgi:hypothetical protein